MKDSFFTNITDILKSVRFWILVFFVLISVLTINFNFKDQGVVINGVTVGSLADNSGFEFNSKANPRDFERVLSVNSNQIIIVDDYFNALNGVLEGDLVDIVTDQGEYNFLLSDLGNRSVANYIGLSVKEGAMSNLRLGIELEGGSRLILKPVDEISEEQFDLLVSNLKNRLDIFGASGTKVNKLVDSFSGEKFVIVESISTNKNDIFDLISKQGEFDAKVGNVTVFTGENVLMVKDDPSHLRYELVSDDEDGYVYKVSFSLEIDEEGTNNFFDKTSQLDVVSGSYLSEEVAFFLDGQEITSLSISSAFKTQKISTPQISVVGDPGSTQEKAIDNANKEKDLLKTLLLTKSLPTELNVEQSYSVSSSTGSSFLKNSIIVGVLAVLLVSSVVALRYRHIGIFIGIMIALVGEVIIVFGASALLGLSIDLVAIGGLIAAIGTGVDDQIIITDEYFRDRDKKLTSKTRVKNAFYIIMIAYFTTIAAMAPFLLAAGSKIVIYMVITILNILISVLFLVRLNSKFKYKLLMIVAFWTFTFTITPLFFSPVLLLLKGFAFVIIIGVTIGVFVTRPAYATMLRIIMTSREERKEEAQEDED
ncbi:MAG: hypothetical protein PF569_06125 [Candidatus Woesearchaeota archaeon]|jgi:preprotein translocase subunit SecD|nr:hypothetical protein [Candidatus Woesearchaeota archaeon]